MKFFVGIDNSESGALAIVDSDGNRVAHMLMPMMDNKDNEVDTEAILCFLEDNMCHEDNTLIALEKPHKFTFGRNAARIMWFCFGKVKVAIEMSDYTLYCPLSSDWQPDMLGVVPKGKTKEYAQNAILKLYGEPVAKSKKLSSGLNDAYLIAEWLRLKHLSIS